MVTTIRLTGIEAVGRHGVYAREKTTAQRFVVDVECVVERPDDVDDLVTTVDYGALASRIARVVAEESYDLIETLASRIARECLTDSTVSQARITVHKPEVRLAVPVSDVAVFVQLGREMT